MTGGLDWARDDHAVSVVDARGRELARHSVEHSAAGLRELTGVLAHAGWPWVSQAKLANRADMTQPGLSRLEAGGVVPTIPLLERISAALEADLVFELAPHAA